MVIVLALLVALAGLVIYGFTKDTKLVEIGRIMFWVGLLAFLLIYHGQPFSVTH